MNQHAPVPPGGGAGGYHTGPEPWHLWGTTDVVRIVGAGGVTAPRPVNTQQLVNVLYKHPTTWCLFFHVKMSISTGVPLNAMFVDFNVQIGVGRTNIRMDPFARVSMTVAEMQDDSLNQRWASSFQARELDTASAIFTPAPNFIQNIPAQSIQVGASLHSTGAQTLGQEFTAAITALAAPLVHVRPDWFEQHFAGGELGGL